MNVTGMLQFPLSWRRIKMEFRKINSDWENLQCDFRDLKSVNFFLVCANDSISIA